MSNDKDTKKDTKVINAEEFDRIFDEGQEDVLQYFDMSSARWVEPKSKRVNVDMPVWMLRVLDHEAVRLGITRQSLIKTWLAEKIENRQGRN